MIWAVDLDDSQNSALNALLQPDGLGKFRKQNGVGSNNLDDFVGTGASCILGECSSQSPSCPRGYVKHGHDISCGGDKGRRNICCELGQSPDEKSCAWRDGGGLFNIPGFFCGQSACRAGEVMLVENDRFWVENTKDPSKGDAACLTGEARYCCKTVSCCPFLRGVPC